jgi:hypothetical protein
LLKLLWLGLRDLGLRLRHIGCGDAIDAHLVQELREVGGREKHASKVSETSIFLVQSTILKT